MPHKVQRPKFWYPTLIWWKEKNMKPNLTIDLKTVIWASCGHSNTITFLSMRKIKGNGEINHQKHFQNLQCVFTQYHPFYWRRALYTLRFTALESGKLAWFYWDRHQFYNESFNYNNQCYKPYENIVLVEEEKMWNYLATAGSYRTCMLQRSGNG